MSGAVKLSDEPRELLPVLGQLWDSDGCLVVGILDGGYTTDSAGPGARDRMRAVQIAPLDAAG